MKLPDLKIGQFLSNNATTLLTASGVVGVVGTAVLTARASFLASEKIFTEELERDHETRAKQDLESRAEYIGVEKLSKTDKVKMTWPYFIPPVVCGSATIAAIIMSNRVSAKQAAALAAAYGLSQNQLEEYKAKVLKSIGVNKEQKIRDEIAQDQVDKNPPKGQVVLLGEGQVLCYDSLSGRYFQCTVDRIRKAENAVNGQLFHHQICSLSFFYDEIGLEPTDLSDGLGWSMATADHSQLEIELSTTKTDDEKPCLVLNFNNMPKHDYQQLY